MKSMEFKVLGLPNTLPNTANSLVFLRRRRQTMEFLEFHEFLIIRIWSSYIHSILDLKSYFSALFQQNQQCATFFALKT